MTVAFKTYAAQDGSPQTTQIAQAIAAALTDPDQTLDITGNYVVESASFQNVNGLRIIGRGSLIAVAGGVSSTLLEFICPLNLTIDADWYMNVNYETGYDNAIWLHTGSGGSASYCRFDGLKAQDAKQAWKIGRDDRPDDQVSEIEILGTTTRGCPSGVLVIGTQAVVVLNGGTIESSAVGGNSAWAALPQKTILSRGATVSRMGGETMHVGLSTGGVYSDYNTLLQVQPIASTLPQGNTCGNINLIGGVVETAAPLGTTDSNGISSATGGALNVQNVRGVSTGTQTYFLATDGTFTGRVEARNNDFFSVPVRTLATAIMGNSQARLIADSSSFGKNFVQGSGAFVGGAQTITN
jgi:hypothetical protein